MQGTLRKLKSSHAAPVQYHLPIGDELVSLNDYIGKTLTLTLQAIFFVATAARKPKKVTRKVTALYACVSSLAVICVL